MLILKRPIKGTTILIIGFLFCLAGIGLARLNILIDSSWGLLFLILTLATWRRNNSLKLICIILLLFTVGWMRGSSYIEKLNPYTELNGDRVIASVIADTDGYYNDKSQLTFIATDIDIIEPYQENLVGKIKVDGFGANAVYRGDKITVEGKLYKTRGSNQARIGYAELSVVGRKESLIENLRLRFLSGMQNALPEPQASFALGLLLGQKSSLPTSVSEQLSKVGLTHIIAVSGYNLTIIILAVRQLMGKKSKYQMTIISIMLLGLFVIFTGSSSSIVRASLVCILVLFALYNGHKFRPVLLISMVAAITALWYPIYLWSDIGWYLSFFAFFGVLVIAPILLARFRKNHNKDPKTASFVLSESFSAQIMTLPLILYIFHQVSLVSLIANIIVVPLVPIAMLLSLVAGIAGMLTPTFAGLFSLPARILLTFMLDVANILSRIPHALVQKSINLSQMIFLYLVIIIITVSLYRFTKNQRDIIYREDTF